MASSKVYAFETEYFDFRVIPTSRFRTAWARGGHGPQASALLCGCECLLCVFAATAMEETAKCTEGDGGKGTWGPKNILLLINVGLIAQYFSTADICIPLYTNTHLICTLFRFR